MSKFPVNPSDLRNILSKEKQDLEQCIKDANFCVRKAGGNKYISLFFAKRNVEKWRREYREGVRLLKIPFKIVLTLKYIHALSIQKYKVKSSRGKNAVPTTEDGALRIHDH